MMILWLTAVVAQFAALLLPLCGMVMVQIADSVVPLCPFGTSEEVAFEETAGMLVALVDHTAYGRMGLGAVGLGRFLLWFGRTWGLV